MGLAEVAITTTGRIVVSEDREHWKLNCSRDDAEGSMLDHRPW